MSFLPSFRGIYRHAAQARESPDVRKVDSPTVKFGILGAANIAPSALLAPASRNPDVVVVAVAARDVNKAKQYATKHKIPVVCDSYDELLSLDDINAVYNPLPNALHCEWTLKALNAGKHVLCEKPMSSNASEAEQMTSVANEKKLVLVEAFHYRYHPAALRAKKIITEELGKIEYIETEFSMPNWLGGKLFPKDDIRFNLSLAGGIFMDAGCYPSNMIRYFSGEEPEVTAAKDLGLISEGVEKGIEVDVKFPSGATGKVIATFFSNKWFPEFGRVVVKGENGTLVASGLIVAHAKNSITFTPKDGKSRTEMLYTDDGMTTYEYQLRAFVERVKGDETATPTDAKDAILNMTFIDSVYKAAGLPARQHEEREANKK